MDDTLLEVENLAIRFRTHGGEAAAVSDVSFTLKRGETLAMVGESGSGKSVTSLALMRLLPKPPLCTVSGSIRLRGADGAMQELLSLPEPAMRAVRGNQLSMVFQEPMTSLNPVKTIGAQITETIRLHRPMPQRAAEDEAARLLELVGIPSPRQRLSAYPHQLSGGMRQRAMIAMALSCEPSVLIADEPTTALDVTIQAQILDLLRRLQERTGMAVIFITHNLGVVAEIADRVMVMYAGRVVEQADVVPLFRQPLMPYTQGLLRSVPRLELAGRRAGALPAIRGNVPDPRHPPPGCAFHPRCDFFRAGECDQTAPMLETTEDDRQIRCLRWQQVATELMAGSGGTLSPRPAEPLV
ncbi:ABC transporter ATP-binding protein [Pseudoroseomonas cervicalis]|uniref:ABC transporter ATP-binding protein n=1 Tax=Teichococcus cervicalis TaxID=204525 RepID=UPI002781D7F0|nr:ABC transporter ATP-binding protein [Pseudoroseomonas cervicalis]MDQ1080945.1 oligopeptide transport system ATP-binding protein [Pseudoroseomonas cervicalis]